MTVSAPQEPLSVQHLKNGYYVVDARGKPVSGRLSYAAEAEIRLDKIRRKEASTRRPCMCCRQRFDSEGPHNRLCGRCRYYNLSPLAL